MAIAIIIIGVNLQLKMSTYSWRCSHLCNLSRYCCSVVGGHWLRIISWTWPGHRRAITPTNDAKLGYAVCPGQTIRS